MLRHLIVLIPLLVAGCGVETAGTAATVGAMKAQEAEAANNARDDIQNKINAATLKEQERLEQAEENAQ